MTNKARETSERRTLHMVSLGCPKNRVDSERMVGLALRQGMTLVGDPEQAQVILINTCGFIDAAKQESVDVILRLAELKQSAQCRSLVVAGCLAQRYPQQLASELPEVDHFIGTADLARLERILEPGATAQRVSVGQPVGLEERHYQRKLVGAPHTAYLKISEGCNRPCAFCIIPLMRGRQRSRSVASLVAETEQLVAQGVVELILVAQDSTAYGRDLGPGTDLPALLTALNAVDGLRWIRIHYAYPSMVDVRLAECMATLPKVAPYIDLPIQHVDAKLLRRMRRGYDERHVRRALDALRAAMPHVALRTTFLLGHPGETEAAHRALLSFVEASQLDHVGAFSFSSEEGTHAATQGDRVPRQLAEERVAQIMELQRSISRAKLATLRGRRVEVLVDGISDESEFLMAGRTWSQSPEIDGQVLLSDGTALAGDFVSVTVTDSGDYDLVATMDQAA